MPPSPRITIRLTPALEALVSARVGHGSSVSDIVREALEAYLGACQTPRQTHAASVSDSAHPVSDTLSDVLSDTVSAMMSDIVSDVSDMREHLEQLEARLEELSASVRHRPTPRPTPQPPATAYDPDAAYARMQALQAQGQSLAQIAAQLTAEGIRTRHGQPWHKSTVAYVLKTHGR
jgi:Arc/MetJ-type ribon-helix-helix transcriptional regulator